MVEAVSRQPPAGYKETKKVRSNDFNTLKKRREMPPSGYRTTGWKNKVKERENHSAFLEREGKHGADKGTPCGDGGCGYTDG